MIWPEEDAMSTPHFDQGHCPLRRHETGHEDKDDHREWMAFLATLSREQRRLYAAVESNRLGRGGVAKVAAIMGLCGPTIARGRRELACILRGESPEKVHRPSPGRPPTEKKYPTIASVLEEMLDGEVAGS